VESVARRTETLRRFAPLHDQSRIRQSGDLPTAELRESLQKFASFARTLKGGIVVGATAARMFAAAKRIFVT
jgi:hypothetical protein